MYKYFNEANPTVCFFDSGIGGLPFLSESANKLHACNFIYFADNDNVPYGRFNHEELITRADTIFSKIEMVSPRAAVIACNTVTAHCISFLRDKYPFPIIGVQPAIKLAAKTAKKCLVLSTVATAGSQRIKELVKMFGGGVTEVIGCPHLADYIEKNIFDLKAEKVRAMLPKVKADAVVLGCTHYIYVKKIIAEFYGCAVFDGVDGTTNRLCSVLGDLVPEINGKKGQIYYSGGNEKKNKAVFESVIRGI